MVTVLRQKRQKRWRLWGKGETRLRQIVFDNGIKDWVTVSISCLVMVETKLKKQLLYVLRSNSHILKNNYTIIFALVYIEY